MTDRPTNRIVNPARGRMPDPRTERVYSPYPDESSAPTQASSLAWSSDNQVGPDPAPYYGDEYAQYPAQNQSDIASPVAWYSRAPVYLAAAAFVAVLAAGGGLAYVLTGSSKDATVPPSKHSVAPAVPQKAPVVAPQSPPVVIPMPPPGDVGVPVAPAPDNGGYYPSPDSGYNSGPNVAPPAVDGPAPAAPPSQEAPPPVDSPAPAEPQSPPANGQTPPANGQTPPANGQTPPANGQTPPANGQTPPVNGQTPPVNGQTPPVNGQTPPVNGQTPPVNGQTPPANGQTPPANGQTPPANGQTPPANGQAPAKNGSPQSPIGGSSPNDTLCHPKPPPC